MKSEDFPSLFLAADRLAAKAQSSYKICMGIMLGSLILAAGLINLTTYGLLKEVLLRYSILGTMMIAIGSGLLLLWKNYEGLWYQGRAIAESCKSLTWRFISRADHITGLDPLSAYLDRFKILSTFYPKLAPTLKVHGSRENIFTDQMHTLRQAHFTDRKNYYLEHRLRNQIHWYQQKATSNRIAFRIGILMVIAFLALGQIVFLTGNILRPFPNASLLILIVLSILSWLQVQGYREHYQAYQTAAMELNSAQDSAHFIKNEEELSMFVAEVELAISREHTLQIARKAI